MIMRGMEFQGRYSDKGGSHWPDDLMADTEAMNPRLSNDSDKSREAIASMLSDVRSQQAAQNRKQDAQKRLLDSVCYFFWGYVPECNGEVPKIEPTKESWCYRAGQIPTKVNQIMATWVAVITVILGFMTWISRLKQ